MSPGFSRRSSMDALLEYGSSSDSDTSPAEVHDGVPPRKRARKSAASDAQHKHINTSLPDGPLETALGSPGATGWPEAIPSALEALGTGLGDSVEPPEGSDHKGCIRSFAHVEGNYATHVYITVLVPDKVQQPLQNFLQQVKASFPGLEPVHDTGGPQQPCSNVSSRRGSGLLQPQYHISLSRTVPVRLRQIESLVGTLKQQLRKLDTFTIGIGGPEVLINDERTRTFLALSATATGNNLQRPTAAARGIQIAGSGGSSRSLLLRAIDSTSHAFRMHGLPPFYAEPRPHISVAWLLGDCEQQLAAALQSSPPLWQAAQQLAQCRWQVQVDAICCKAGQKAFIVWGDK